MASVIEARVMSINDEEIFRLTGNTKNASILQAKFSTAKIGGLLNFELIIQKLNPIPIFNKMRFDFYYRDDIFLTKTKIFSGYTDDNAIKNTSDKLLSIKGTGYYNKLNEKQLTQTYTAKTINYILNDLDLASIGLNLSDNIISDFFYFNIGFKNKSYKQVLDYLLQIANTTYSTEQFIYGVDENKQLYFYSLPSTGDNVNQKYFEGFDFQYPELSIESDIINKVVIFRPTSADAKETELVGTYTDADSITQNGPIEKKIIVPDYADNNAIEKFANAILSEKSKALKNISIKNFYRVDTKILESNIIYADATGSANILVDDGSGECELYYRTSALNEERYRRILEQDYYGLAIKPQEVIDIIHECRELTNWTQSLSSSTIELSDDQLLIERNSFYWYRNAGQAYGDYIEITLDKIITGITELSIWLYFLNVVPELYIYFYDTDDNYVLMRPDKTNAQLINKWVEFTETIFQHKNFGLQSPILNDLSVQTNSLIKKLKVNTDNTNINFKVKAFIAPRLKLRLKTNSTIAELKVNTNSANVYLNIKAYNKPLLKNLHKIKIILGDGSTNADNFFIDRIETKSTSWNYERLALAKADYTIDKDYIICDAEFGQAKQTLIDEIKDKINNGDIAFDMYAKN